MPGRAVFYDPFSEQFLELAIDRQLKADSLDAVRPLLDELNGISLSSNQWAVGYLTYESAGAFDDALSTHDTQPPLASFFIGSTQPSSVTPVDQEGQSVSQIIRVPEYIHAVQRILDYIMAGDIYQANYTMPLKLPMSPEPYELWLAWVSRQQSSYAVFMEDGARTILGVSPELFFQIENEQIECRPMKGTRPRGRWSEEDIELRTELAESEKDRAENLMILDMIRNDLGRIAEVGSVQPSALFHVQKLPTVFQMTSTVHARCKFDLSSIFQAIFPSASVTGAPKIRATQIIRELEPLPRGVYCGAVGFVAPGGKACFNVPIRTGVISNSELLYSVGSGIVADSDPEAEWAECQAKAKVITLPKFVSRGKITLIETMRSGQDGIEHLEYHLDRLTKSADYYGIEFDPQYLNFAVPANQLVRLLVSNDRIEIELGELPEIAVPVRLRLAATPVNPNDRFLYHKTSIRGVYEAAKQEAGDADEAVLFNVHGEITETNISNIAIKRNDDWVTPMLDCGLLPGVLRRVLLESGQIVEGRIKLEEFRNASEIMVFNSVRGKRPAVLQSDEITLT